MAQTHFNRIRLFVLVFFSLVLVSNSKAQQKVEASPIKWYTIEEAQTLAAKQPRPFFVDVYTDWCGWCKHMMRTTFSNPDIAKYIQNNYYPVRYDAETTDTINYKGKRYINSDFVRYQAALAKNPNTPRKTKFTHDLAKTILQGRLSYPTIVYIDKQGKENPVSGHMDVNKIQPFLVYFAENLNVSTPFEEFMHMYFCSFPNVYKKELQELKPQQMPDTMGVVKWYSLAEAQVLQKKAPRKILIDFYADFKTSCKVMNRTTYTNSKVAEVLNSKFYPVRINAMHKEPLVFQGKKLINEGKQHPFHQLAVNFSVTGNDIHFPTLVFLDTQLKPITKYQQYIAPSMAAPFFQFIAEDAYKTKKWPVYLKEYTAKQKEQNKL